MINNSRQQGHKTRRAKTGGGIRARVRAFPHACIEQGEAPESAALSLPALGSKLHRLTGAALPVILKCPSPSEVPLLNYTSVE